MRGAARVLLVGFGNMGQALVKGWLARGHAAETIRVLDPAPGARAVAEQLGLEAGTPEDAAVDAKPADVVLLAVKPDQVGDALTDLAPRAASGTLFVSIVAGKPLAVYERHLGSAPVVRAMPNTPAAIGRGMTVLCPNASVSADQRALCESLLSAVGATAWVEDERHMDAVTAVSGSGPAYVFLLIECLAEAGVDAGLEPALARQLAEVTVAGAGAYAGLSEASAAELRRRVTSPGGTTQAALNVLMAEDGLADLMKRAVRAAAARSRQLSAD